MRRSYLGSLAFYLINYLLLSTIIFNVFFTDMKKLYTYFVKENFSLPGSFSKEAVTPILKNRIPLGKLSFLVVIKIKFGPEKFKVTNNVKYCIISLYYIIYLLWPDKHWHFDPNARIQTLAFVWRCSCIFNGSAFWTLSKEYCNNLYASPGQISLLSDALDMLIGIKIAS